MTESKGYISSIETMGLVDGPGIRIVFFLQGCPLRCLFCHNPETWSKNGGIEMEANASLKRLVEKAKKEQVPSDIIKRAIDKVNSGADESYTSASYELFGPAGSTLIVECLTDNVNRSVSSIRAALNKCHVKMGAMGLSLIHI